MLKLKKLNKGMTLVEVIVAMAVFSAMTLGITMALAAAVKYNSRNIRRDNELNVQQTAIETATTAGVKAVSSAYASDEIKFTAVSNGSLILTVDGLTEYSALKSAYNSDDFNFQVKTISSTALGTQRVVFVEDDEYKIEITNLSSEDIMVTLTAENGEIYEGDHDYDSAGLSYYHTIPGYTTTTGEVIVEDSLTGDVVNTAPSGLEVGYENAELEQNLNDNDPTITIKIQKSDGTYLLGTDSSAVDLGGYLTSTNGICSITVDATGGVNLSAS